MRPGTTVFVDTGAWIALALARDPLHERARLAWDAIQAAGAKTVTSIPVVLETFTFLDRNANREVAVRWRESLHEVPRFGILECRAADLEHAFGWFARRDMHELSAVDATSFSIMRKRKIRAAFTFDHHFAQAGFRMV